MSGSEWRAASLPAPLNIGTGAEQIARAALGQIMANIKSQVAQLEVIWASRDQDWAVIMKIPYKPTQITLPKNYYLGAQPSLVAGIGERPDLWPAITCRAGVRKATDDRGQEDQYDSYDVELIIEVLTLAGPFNADPVESHTLSDAVDRQYQRLSDAVVASIDKDRTLSGNILPFQRPPTITPSLPFVKKANKGSGAWYVYQGAEMVWSVTALAY